jgi:hypothetical protein
MAINPDLLIAAPILQDIFVDKTGIPMAGGTVTCYHDNSRTTLKNWYYQTGTPGAYTYVPLPNPLTLSAAGTITDINGVDTIPFFYPYLESDETTVDRYYITIVNFFNTNQITRANFPYNISESSALLTGTSFNNLVINNGFWRNVLPNTVNASNQTLLLNSGSLVKNIYSNFAAIVAPSQHDGFSMPDIQFIKNNLSATDSVTFAPFPLESSLVVKSTNTPEYFINHQCTVMGADEKLKCYQFPISLHINNLANLNYTVSIQASSPTSNIISLNMWQFTGTTVGGTSSPDPHLIQSISLQLTPTLTTYTLTDIFPPSAGLTLGLGSDDAFYLQVSMPMNALCNVNFTKPSLYLTNNAVPAVDYQSYDQVNSIISAPRCGDIRLSLNLIGAPQAQFPGFGSFGWVYANDGTIGSTASGASPTNRNNNDTWLLYLNLWTFTSRANCPVIGGMGASAFADFSANKLIQLPTQLGRFVGNAGNGAGLPTQALAQSNVYPVGTPSPGSGSLAGTYYDLYYKL